MANIGDLVTRLICDASQYSRGTDTAVSSNRALSGSIDSIIGQLERQKKAMQNASLTTRDNILGAAGKGATEGQINVALQLDEEVSALRQKAVAEREAAQAAQDDKMAVSQRAAAGATLLASLREEEATLGMTAAQVRIYKAELAGVNPATIAAARATMERISATKRQALADQESVAQIAAARDAGQSLIATLKAEAATYGMTASEARIYRATLAGVSAEDIKAARDIQYQIDQRRRLDDQLRSSTGAMAGHRSSTMVLTESVRGLEDAVAGYSNNGLKGMLMATTNNMTQIGALAGGVAGLAISLGAVAALIGVSLVPKMIEWYTGTEDQEKATKRLDDEKERFYQNEVRRINSLVAMTQHQIDSNLELRRIGEDILSTDTRSRDERSLRNTAEDREAAASKEAIAVMGLSGKIQQILKNNPGLDIGPGGKAERNRRRNMTAEDRKAAEERDAKAGEEYVRLDEELKASIQRRDSLRAQAVAYEQAADKQAKSDAMKAMRDRLLEEQAEADKDTAKFLAQEKRRADAVVAIRKSAADAVLELIKKGSPMLAEQVEKKRSEDEQRRKIMDAQKKGIITQDEANLALSRVGQRESILPGGGTTALQSGTTGAYSAMVKALQRTKEKELAEKQLKATEDLVPLLEKIEAKEPIKVTTMSV